MLDIIKQLAMDAVDLGRAADFCIGTVVSGAPLCIRLEEGMELTEPFLILAEPVTDWEEEGETWLWRKNEEQRLYQYHMYHNRGLQEGERVALIRAAGGQQYLVLCRAKGGGAA